MQRFNYHTHTSRCGHAKGTDEEYRLAAIETGYKILGFSDHSPYKWMPLPFSRMNYKDLDGYISSLTKLKEKYKDQIDIKIGLETEYFPKYREHYEKLRSRLDYLILGQHFMAPNGTGTFFRYNTPDQIEAYADFICAGLDTGLFTYLCHPDVFLFHQKVFDETCEKTARKILEKAVETNTPIEANVHGVRRKTILSPEGKEEKCYPNRTFWTIASEYPVQCIYGIDAHDPDDLRDMEALRLAEDIVSGLGLSFITEPVL